MNLDDALIDLARRAGAAIMEVYAGEFEVQRKADASPLTVADLRAHHIIVDGLRDMTPDLPIVSEESEPADFELRRTWDRYWLVDPLDGTREFVNRNGDFTVNIALIDANRAGNWAWSACLCAKRCSSVTSPRESLTRRRRTAARR